MESAQVQVTRYVIHTQVVKIEEKFDRVHISGVGSEVKSREVSRGWFVFLRGSYEALHLGFDKPDFAHGDTVKITFEKIANG